MSLLNCFKRRFLKGSKAGAGAAAAKISNSGNTHSTRSSHSNSSRSSAPSVNDTSHSTLNSLVLASVLMDDESFDTPTTKNIAATTMAADPTDDAGKPASSSNNKDLDSLTDNPYKLTPNPNHTSESTYQGSVFNSSSSSDNGSSHSSSSASYSSSGSSSSGSSYSSSSSSDSGSSSSSSD